MLWTYENVRRCLNGDDEFVFHNLASTRFVRGADGVFHLEYHGSRIVTYHPDNTFTVDTCGYATKTTKARINEFSPVVVVQKRGMLYLVNGENENIEFFDGMRVDAFGFPVEDEP